MIDVLEDGSPALFTSVAPGFLDATTVRSQNVDVLNFTAGVHVDILDQTSLRFAGVFPVSGRDKRFFDSEFIVGVEGRF